MYCARLCMHAFENVIIDAFVQNNVRNRISMANNDLHASQITRMFIQLLAHTTNKEHGKVPPYGTVEKGSGFPSQEPAVLKELASSIMPNTQPYRHGRYTWKRTSNANPCELSDAMKRIMALRSILVHPWAKFLLCYKICHIVMLSVLCNICIF